MNRLNGLSLAVLALLSLAACSDEGDSPTGSGTPTTPTLSLTNNVAVAEGAVASLTATLSSPATQDVTFTVNVTDLSAAAADYTTPATMVTIDSGLVTAAIDIATVDDAQAEASELLEVTLSNPNGATLGSVASLVRILPSDGGSDVSFSGTVQSLLQTRCGGCHGGGNTNGGFNMGAITASSVRDASGNNGPVVIIGLGSQSHLYEKTTTTPPFGSRMPQGGPFLTTDQQNAIRDWINQGAQDN